MDLLFLVAPYFFCAFGCLGVLAIANVIVGWNHDVWTLPAVVVQSNADVRVERSIGGSGAEPAVTAWRTEPRWLTVRVGGRLRMVYTRKPVFQVGDKLIVECEIGRYTRHIYGVIGVQLANEYAEPVAKS